MARFQQSLTKMENLFNGKDEGKRRYLHLIHNCPQSLKLFIQFYRFFGFTFTGATFDDRVQKKTKDKPYTISGLLLLLFGVVILIKCYLPFRMSPKAILIENQTMVHYFRMQQYQEDFADLKPILRMVTQSILYVNTIDQAIMYFMANFITGGQLVYQLTQVPGTGSEKFDNKAVVKKMLLYLMAILLTVNVAANVMFNSHTFKDFFSWLFGYKATLERSKKLYLLKWLIITTIHVYNDVVISMVPVLFLYTVLLFRKHLSVIGDSVKNVELDEIALLKIKTRLQTLSEHFSTVMGHFSLVLSSNLVAITFHLVSTCCFLMINSGKQKMQMNYIFTYSLVAFIRLIVLCATGSLLLIRYRDLIRAIYESVPEWDLHSWMAFNEIRRLKMKFKVVVLSMYAIKQSTILAVLAFSLNYIVVLLQTENYSGLQTMDRNATHT